MALTSPDSHYLSLHCEEYQQSLSLGQINTDVFDDCLKLKGSSNYNEWHRDFTNRATRAGFSRLLKETMKPTDPSTGELSVEEWNCRMLEQGYRSGRNESCRTYLNSTLASNMRSLVRSCETVTQALDILDKGCPAVAMEVYIAKYRSFHKFSFDAAIQTFDSFIAEFWRRFFEVNDVRGGRELTDGEACDRLLVALGPHFTHWSHQISQCYSINGSGKGSELEVCEMMEGVGGYVGAVFGGILFGAIAGGKSDDERKGLGEEGR